MWTLLLNRCYLVLWSSEKPPPPRLSTWFVHAPRPHSRKGIIYLRYCRFHRLAGRFHVIFNAFKFLLISLFSWKIRIIHKSDYTLEERLMFKPIVFANTIQSMSIILHAVERMGRYRSGNLNTTSIFL